ncbi:hypothetical protein BC828DRAFT_236717 [Blastocladiella britannica]|nr:hypothetical protein BC828DRAFT_236717 [Blastocladiella britannica]
MIGHQFPAGEQKQSQPLGPLALIKERTHARAALRQRRAKAPGEQLSIDASPQHGTPRLRPFEAGSDTSDASDHSDETITPFNPIAKATPPRRGDPSAVLRYTREDLLTLADSSATTTLTSSSPHVTLESLPPSTWGVAATAATEEAAHGEAESTAPIKTETVSSSPPAAVHTVPEGPLSPTWGPSGEQKKVAVVHGVPILLAPTTPSGRAHAQSRAHAEPLSPTTAAAAGASLRSPTAGAFGPVGSPTVGSDRRRCSTTGSIKCGPPSIDGSGGTTADALQSSLWSLSQAFANLELLRDSDKDRVTGRKYDPVPPHGQSQPQLLSQPQFQSHPQHQAPTTEPARMRPRERETPRSPTGMPTLPPRAERVFATGFTPPAHLAVRPADMHREHDEARGGLRSPRSMGPLGPLTPTSPAPGALPWRTGQPLSSVPQGAGAGSIASSASRRGSVASTVDSGRRLSLRSPTFESFLASSPREPYFSSDPRDARNRRASYQGATNLTGRPPRRQDEPLGETMDDPDLTSKPRGKLVVATVPPVDSTQDLQKNLEDLQRLATFGGVGAPPARIGMLQRARTVTVPETAPPSREPHRSREYATFDEPDYHRMLQQQQQQPLPASSLVFPFEAGSSALPSPASYQLSMQESQGSGNVSNASSRRASTVPQSPFDPMGGPWSGMSAAASGTRISSSASTSSSSISGPGQYRHMSLPHAMSGHEQPSNPGFPSSLDVPSTTIQAQPSAAVAAAAANAFMRSSPSPVGTRSSGPSPALSTGERLHARRKAPSPPSILLQPRQQLQLQQQQQQQESTSLRAGSPYLGGMSHDSPSPTAHLKSPFATQPQFGGSAGLAPAAPWLSQEQAQQQQHMARQVPQPASTLPTPQYMTTADAVMAAHAAQAMYASGSMHPTPFGVSAPATAGAQLAPSTYPTVRPGGEFGGADPAMLPPGDSQPDLKRVIEMYLRDGNSSPLLSYLQWLTSVHPMAMRSFINTLLSVGVKLKATGSLMGALYLCLRGQYFVVQDLMETLSQMDLGVLDMINGNTIASVAFILASMIKDGVVTPVEVEWMFGQLHASETESATRLAGTLVVQLLAILPPSEFYALAAMLNMHELFAEKSNARIAYKLAEWLEPSIVKALMMQGGGGGGMQGQQPQPQQQRQGSPQQAPMLRRGGSGSPVSRGTGQRR